MEKMIAPCGLDCAACDARIATLANDDKHREEIAEVWRTQYGADITAEMINCVGCLEEGAHIRHCAECEIRACAVGKGYDTCAECDDYACDTVSGLLGAVPAAKANLDALRK